MVLIFVLLHISGMTGICHYAQPLIEMGHKKFFVQLASNNNPPNLCLPIYASQVARIRSLRLCLA
jgi:hypothetical protein